MQVKISVFYPLLVLFFKLEGVPAFRCHYCIDTKEACAKLPAIIDCEKEDYCTLEAHYKLKKKYYPKEYPTFDSFLNHTESEATLAGVNATIIAKMMDERRVPNCTSEDTDFCYTISTTVNGIRLIETGCGKENHCNLTIAKCATCRKELCNAGRKSVSALISTTLLLTGVATFLRQFQKSIADKIEFGV